MAALSGFMMGYHWFGINLFTRPYHAIHELDHMEKISVRYQL